MRAASWRAAARSLGSSDAPTVRSADVGPLVVHHGQARIGRARGQDREDGARDVHQEAAAAHPPRHDRLPLLERHDEVIRQGHRDRGAVRAGRVHGRQRSQRGLQGGGGQRQQVDAAASVEAERMAHRGGVGVVRAIELQPVGREAEGTARGEADEGHQRRHQDDRGADALRGAVGGRRPCRWPLARHARAAAADGQAAHDAIGRVTGGRPASGAPEAGRPLGRSPGRRCARPGRRSRRRRWTRPGGRG